MVSSVRLSVLAVVTSLTLATPAVAGDIGVVVAGCVPCHGEDGIARDAEVPHLAGQNELYLANQMRAFRSGERAQPEMHYMMEDLEDGTIAALAAYFAELPPRP
jgi:cytochrome c553